MLHHTATEAELDHPIDEVEDMPFERPSELEALLQESLSLENLLDESMGLQNEANKIKASRKALSEGTIKNKAERNATIALIRSWEAKREWVAEADCIKFVAQVCKCCGEQNHVFEGYFQRQSHKLHKSMRWIALETAPKEGSALPKEMITEMIDVDYCLDCALAASYEQDWIDDEEVEEDEEVVEQQIAALINLEGEKEDERKESEAPEEACEAAVGGCSYSGNCGNAASNHNGGIAHTNSSLARPESSLQVPSQPISQAQKNPTWARPQRSA